MIFRELPLEQAEGALLAHSHKTSQGRISKGQVLTKALLSRLRADGVLQVTVAMLDVNDVHEDQAAKAMATALQGEHIRLGSATTGRVNLHASGDGLFDFDPSTINAINRVHESLTVATLMPSTRVVAGQIVATIKIITYALNAELLAQAIGLTSTGLRVEPLRPSTVCIIQTTVSGMKAPILDNTRQATEHRLLERKATLISEQRVPHSLTAVAEALHQAQSCNPDWILIFGASATSDQNDTVPAAVILSGGSIDHFGMPVDPGNLLVMGRLDKTIVIGMPGCARSAKKNGADKVLDRLACGVPVTSEWICSLGIGGLLQEIVDRPRPRVVANKQTRVSALLLCAGSSNRFGATNKLLANWQGAPLIRQTLQNVVTSAVDSTLIVTGHEHRKIRTSTENLHPDHTIHYLHNEAHSTGMASSLIKGVSALIDSDAVVVCLGDMPMVQSSTIDKLVGAFKNHPDKALYIPTYGGKRGNPVLIARRLFDSILSLTGDTGARVLARQFPDTVMEIPIDNPQILTDIDTPDDLQKDTHI